MGNFMRESIGEIRGKELAFTGGQMDRSMKENLRLT